MICRTYRYTTCYHVEESVRYAFIESNRTVTWGGGAEVTWFCPTNVMSEMKSTFKKLISEEISWAEHEYINMQTHSSGNALVTAREGTMCKK